MELMRFFILMLAWAAILPLVWAWYDRVYFSMDAVYEKEQLKAVERFRNWLLLSGVVLFALLGLADVFGVLS